MPDSNEKPAPVHRRPYRLPPAWIVIAVALGALGFLAAGSFLKAAQSRDHLMLRNHRALSRIADWANLLLEGEARRLALLIRDQRITGTRPVFDQIQEGIGQARKGPTPRDRDLYDGLAVERVTQASCPGQPLPTALDVPGARVCSSYTVEPEGGALRVRVLMAGNDSGGGPGAGSARNLELSRRISLDRLFREGPGLGLFDKFVAADDAGNVLFELGGTAATLSNLEEALRSSAVTGEAKNTAADTRAAASARTLEIGSRSYWLFTRPLRGVSSAPGQNAAAKAPTIVLGGLTPTQSLDREARRISPTLLLYISLIGLAVFLSVPLLKLVSIGPADRLRATDGLRVALCTVFSSGLIAIAAADVHEYLRLRAVVDAEVEGLARDVRNRLREELLDARNTALLYREPLDQMCRCEPARCKAEDVFWRHGTTDYPAKGRNPGTSDCTAAGRDPRIGRSRLFAERDPDQVLHDFPYPFFASVFLTDRAGKQIEKFSVRSLNTRWTSVSRRVYYRDLADHPYQLRLDPGEAGPAEYRLEPVYSFTDGRWETMLALRRPGKLGDGEPPFVYMSTQLLSLYGTVLPEGFGFAIVDGDGNVLYHADERRNLAENFLTECDGDRWLRAALRATSGRTGDVPYMGVEHRMHVAPIEGTPWALVTFFDKQALRSMNVEASTLAVAMFALLVVLCFTLVGISALVSPHLLKRRFWMEPAALRHYGAAVLFLSAIDVVFLTALAAGFGHRLFLLSLVVPLAGLVGTSFLLTPRRPGSRGPQLRAQAFGAAVLAAVLFGAVWTTVGFGSVGWRWLTFWLAAVAALMLLVRHRRRATFVAAASLLMALIGILPAIGFFKTAFEHEVDLMVRKQQIDLVRQLETRKRAVLAAYNDDFPKGMEVLANRRLTLIREGGKEQRDIYVRFWMDTAMREETAASCAAQLERLPRARSQSGNPAWYKDTGEFFRRIRPYFGRFTVENADMFIDEVRGRRWSWLTAPGGETVLLVDCSHSYASADVGGDGDLRRGFGARLLSTIPVLRSNAPATWFLTLLLLSLMVWRAVRLMAAKLALLYEDGPRGLAPAVLLRPFYERPTLVLGAGADTVEGVVEHHSFFPIELQGGWTAESAVRSVPSDATATVMDLDAVLDDPQHHARLMDLLDTLIGSGRRVVLFGRRHPNDGFPWHLDSEQRDSLPDPQLRARWGEFWLKFDVLAVREPRQDDLPPEGTAASIRAAWLSPGIVNPARMRDTIVRECRHTIPLQRIGRAIARAASIPDGNPTSPGESLERAVLGDIFERATSHYTQIWSRCSTSERRVLHQIAATGLVNWRNASVLRRLVRMGLVHWEGNLTLFNATFSRYVSECVDAPALYKPGTDETPSVWRMVRVPLVVTLMVVAAVMFMTQPELFGSAVAVAAAVAGAIPLVLRLLSALEGKAPDRS